MSGEEGPSDTMRERVPESSAKFWLLLQADRLAVTVGILGVLFLGLLALGVLHPTPAAELLRRGDPIETLFQAVVGATVTGVTLVLTIGQLVLSQEQGPVGDQQERMSGAMAFRRDVESLVDEGIAPAEPAAFLRSLVEFSRRRAGALEDATAGQADERLLERVDALVDTVEGNAQRVATTLDGAQFGTFDVVFSALNFNYSWKLHAARRILSEHGAALSTDAREALEDLVEAMELFGPAREHIKTLYFQWELINLSRAMLYASVPALVVSIGSMLFLDPGRVVGSTVGVANVLLLAAAAVTVSLLPFAILLAYMLRILTVTKRTLSIGPFILRETDRSADFDTVGEE